MNRTPVADWQQLSALYELADTLDADTLGDWLEQLRLQSHPLLGQLQEMLEAREQVRGNGFLGTLPRLTRLPEPATIEWQGGSRIGSYKLLHRLGSGGMAEVWLAQRADGAFERRVAIKLLYRHAGSNERDTFAQRFSRERDILASLNHPLIAGLHDAGVTPGGQPWLALEYVEGQTLTQSCDARRLGIEARVRLFRQVLLAVQHAHANLVIHRDLKPCNILVTEEGQVRLLDFGIAKLLEPEGAASVETELTRMAGRPMTPQYAAPEQLLGHPLTTACDVYALGVVLYELLCGERPYELKVDSAAQLEQAILDTEPRAPSRRVLSEPTAEARGTTAPALRRLLTSDLDAIVLRALAKQPSQRYGSVEAFRADLDRWLDGEPVEARAPSTVYRVAKFVRRHGLGVSLGAGAIVSLITVAAVAVVMGLQAREDSARAVAARDFMLNIFARANQEKSRGADITARDLLETGRKDVLVRLAGQPKLQAELLKGIAKIQTDMGEYVTADSTYADLVNVYQRLRQPREHVLAQLDHGLNALNMNNPALARRLLIDIESARGRALPDVEIDVGVARLKAWLALNAGDSAGAMSLLSVAYPKAVSDLGATDLRTFRLGQAMARAFRDSGRIGEALVFQEQLRHSARQINGLGADEFASMDWEQVNLLSGTGQFNRALRMSQQVLPRCIEELGAEAQPCRYLLVKQAQMLFKLGRVDEAKEALPRLHAISADVTLPFLQIEALILELRLQSIGASPGAPALSSVANDVRGFARSSSGISVQATLRAGAVLALAEERLRAADLGPAQALIAEALALLGDSGAEAPKSKTAAHARMLMGILMMEQGHGDESMRWLRRSHDYYAQALGVAHPTVQVVALNIALVLDKVGRRSEALKTVQNALPILRDAFGSDSPSYHRVVQLLERWPEAPNAALESGDALTANERNMSESYRFAQQFFVI